jgi:hypothetical protein
MASAPATQDATTGTVTTPSVSAKFHAMMLERAQNAEGVGDAAFDSQLSAMMNASTEDELWESDEKGTISAKDAAGLEVEFRDMTSHESNNEEIEGGHGYFITSNCVCIGGPKNLLVALGLKIGDEFVLSTGAPLVVGKLRWFEANEKLPVRAVIIKAGRAIKLARLPERATTSA